MKVSTKQLRLDGTNNFRRTSDKKLNCINCVSMDMQSISIFNQIATCRDLRCEIDLLMYQALGGEYFICDGFCFEDRKYL